MMDGLIHKMSLTMILVSGPTKMVMALVTTKQEPHLMLSQPTARNGQMQTVTAMVTTQQETQQMISLQMPLNGLTLTMMVMATTPWATTGINA